MKIAFNSRFRRNKRIVNLFVNFQQGYDDRYGKKNKWKESSVEFWRNGDLLDSTNEFFAYYHVRDYADYLYEDGEDGEYLTYECHVQENSEDIKREKRNDG